MVRPNNASAPAGRARTPWANPISMKRSSVRRSLWTAPPNSDGKASEVELRAELDQARIHDADRRQPAVSVCRCDGLRVIRIEHVGEIHVQSRTNPAHPQDLRKAQVKLLGMLDELLAWR